MRRENLTDIRKFNFGPLSDFLIAKVFTFSTTHNNKNVLIIFCFLLIFIRNNKTSLCYTQICLTR